jgi:hypothetical protein
MKKNGLQFLILTALTAIVAGACMASFDPSGEPVEYDAQGRRLVTVSVNLDNAARAVNIPVAQAYIDFYEVVFVRNSSEYYSATTTKGAGKTLSLRVPVAGTYKAYLNAGHLIDSDNAVLLAQASDLNSPTLPALPDPVNTHAWTFNLTALALRVNGPTGLVTPGNHGPSNTSNSIYVEIDSSDGELYVTDGKIPYYKLQIAAKPVVVTVKTGAANVVDYGSGNVSVVSLGSTSPSGLDGWIKTGASSSAPPAFDATTGKLTFSFDTPSPIPDGLSNVGFDVTVALVSAARNNGAKPIRWHIRSGLYVEQYDNGIDDVTNTGAGLVFAWGTTVPATETETAALSVPVGTITGP